MTNQVTNTFFMIRPVSFKKNEETAQNNYFQREAEGVASVDIQTRALNEFDLLVEKLREHGIAVLVFDDNSSSTPDSIFPNNWVSTHGDGTLITYPMYAKNRRLERREDIIEALKSQFDVKFVQQLEDWENQEMYLEGTGSMVLDRQHKIAYASISGRTDPAVFRSFCEIAGYEGITFTSYQTIMGKRLPIYHTNVMMAIGESYSIICLDCIDNLKERALVKASLVKSGKRIIEISQEQMTKFAGNTLEMQSEMGKVYTVMSDSAYNVFSATQRKEIEQFGQIIHSPIPVIEQLGGGSVRCMIAEIFLQKK